MKKILLFIFLSLFVWIAFDLSRNFSMSKIQYEWSESKKWMLPSSNFSFNKEIFDQKFTYLDQGNQSYVFISSDKNYVIKFFKFDHLKPSRWLNWLPNFSLFEKYKLKKRKAQVDRLVRLYQGHWIAETYNKNNSGIVYTHLHPTKNFINKKINIIGPYNIHYEIDLDEVPFVLQKKATTTRKLLTEYLEKNEKEKIILLIDNLFTLYLNEYKNGIYDRDYNVIDNTGFQNERAFRIDVGKLRYNLDYKEKDIYKLDIQQKLARRLNRWIDRHYPNDSQWIKNYLDTKILNL